MSSNQTPSAPGSRWRLVSAFVAATAFAAGLAALLVNISGRKAEALNPTFRVVELTDETVDPATWGKDFPVQYDLYLKTAEMTRDFEILEA